MTAIVARGAAVVWMLSMIACEGGEAPSAAKVATPRAPTDQFDLSQLTIPPGQIARPGPKKDDIPSLRTFGDGAAQVLPATQATDLSPNARVVGVEINGQARAYPIHILNYHEVVNDELGGEPIAVVFSPLCDAVCVWQRGALEFGVSGLLAHANALLYDRNDHALWAQLKFAAVSGPNAGQRLAAINRWEVTTLGQWVKRYPGTTVLTERTGHQRPYMRNPYRRYLQVEALMAGAKAVDRRMPNKTRVVGVLFGDQARAYVVHEIHRRGGALEDTIGGQLLRIEADENVGNVRIVQAPPGASVVHTFWFAWAAFHPQTELVGVESVPDSHQRMVAALRAVAREMPETNEFLGDSRTRMLKGQLDQLPPQAGAQRHMLNVLVGNQLLRQGQTKGAIEHFDIAEQLLAHVGDKDLAVAGGAVNMLKAVAHLRDAETQNCCLAHNADSCILPIRGGGVHTVQEPSRKAIAQLKQVFANPHATDAQRLGARWLINLAYMTIGEYPAKVPADLVIDPQVFTSKVSFPRLYDVAMKLGLDSFDHSGSAIVDDFDNDGDLDVVASSYHPEQPLHYQTNNGDGTFTARGAAAGFEGINGGLNMVQADYDNDGDIDFYVTRGAWLGIYGHHPNSLMRNNGDATFTDVTFDVGLGERHFPTQTAAWGDYDLDGDLDLYVGNESPQEKPDVGFPSELYRNNGDGTFTDVAHEAGATNRRFAKAVVFGDYDGDRYPDLYVANWLEPNRLYHNNGDGTFTDVAEKLGVTKPLVGFGSWFWDYDNDGHLDLFSSWYDYSRPHPAVAAVAADQLGLPSIGKTVRLYRNNGNGGFDDVTKAQRLDFVTMTMGCNFGDLDGDGFLDFYLGTGYPGYEGLMPNLMFVNRGGGGFDDVTYASGLGHIQKGHGISFADMDHDGDQDIFIQLGGALPVDAYNNALFENPGFGNRFLVVKAVGTRSNRSALGTRLHVVIEEAGNTRSIYKHVNSGGTFGCNPLRQHIGLGKADRIVRLEVFWPASDTTQVFEDVALNQFIEVTEGSQAFHQRPYQPISWRK